MSEVTSKGAALGLALFTAAAASAVNNPAQAQIAQGQCPPDTKTVVGWVDHSFKTASHKRRS